VDKRTQRTEHISLVSQIDIHMSERPAGNRCKYGVGVTGRSLNHHHWTLEHN
jgi:hypothetical protein